MAQLVPALVLVVCAACSPFVVSSGEAGSPLVVGIVADPLLLDRFKNREEFEAHIRDIVNRASLVFHADVGRRLVPGEIEVGLPPNAGPSVESADVFAMLSGKLRRFDSAKRKPQFLVFLADRPLASCGIPGIWSGCAILSDPRSIVVYESDVGSVVGGLLHELGHNCGAGHSKSQDSIMYPWSRGNATYGDERETVRKNCG